jgi:hypothetical protein
MGFRMKKSINLGGGFRINLSKSGIGYSWGIPGYRITKTAKGTTRRTYSIPGTGLSHTEESGKRRNRSNTPPSNPIPVNDDVMQDIESADIAQFQSAEVANITKTIEKTILVNNYGTILLWLTVLAVGQPLFLICTGIGIILKIMARKIGVVSLEYSFEDGKADEYDHRTEAWMTLAECQKVWQIVQEATVTNRKVNAGAGRNVNRIPLKIEKKAPFYLHSNVEIIMMKLKKETLLLLPDKVFVIRKGKVGVINYADINIDATETLFIESEPVPKDAQIVDHTWQYVNKNGTPDKRFKNNRQLPVCQYGKLSITSTSGLNVELHCSNRQKAFDYAKRVNQLGIAEPKE